jgi:hypothetical protein
LLTIVLLAATGKNNYIEILTINTKPSQRALAQPLSKRLPASDRVDP